MPDRTPERQTPNDPRPNVHCEPRNPVLEMVIGKIDGVVQMVRDLAKRIKALPQATDLVTKQDLRAMENRIMSKFTDDLAKVQTALDGISSATDDNTAAVQQLSTSFQGLDGDFKNLKAQIDKLNAGTGDLGVADQGALDAIQTSANALVTKVQTTRDAIKGVADAAKALDAQTAALPTVPPAPTGTV